MRSLSRRLPPLRHYIGATWVDGPAVFALHDPGSAVEVARSPIASDAVVAQAVAAARRAAASWTRTVPAERAGVLLRLADAIDAESAWLAELESFNVGKPIAAAREEIPLVSDVRRFYAGAARVGHGVAGGEYAPGLRSVAEREPLGVVGLITPWNYPLLEAMWKIGPALAAGNSIVLKPSEITPYTTIELARIAGGILPEGVLNIVLGDAPTGSAIVESPDIAMVSLTGDTRTGRKVAAAAAETLKRVHLELGGKAPALVFDDIDVGKVAPRFAAYSFVNAGQDCTAACRLIVHRSVYDDFVDAFVEAAKALQIGDPADPATQTGPVVSLRQAERVLGFIGRAGAQGGRVLAGGRRVGPGYLIEPTIITDLDQSAEAIQNEIFGPVATVQRADSDEQMLEWGNDVSYGLSSSVWTKDLARANRVSRELRFGTVWVNEHLTTVPEMPFGGFGGSGYGKELSSVSIDEYSQLKHVMTRID